jgi:hypothetical protein
MTRAEPRAAGRRRPLAIALAAVLGAVTILVLLAIAQQVRDRPTASPSVSSPVDGVIIAVDAAGLGDVRGFTLQPSSSPFALTFELGTLENPTEFPPGHLAEHLASSQPVRAYFRRSEDGRHVVYRLEDASPVAS